MKKLLLALAVLTFVLGETVRCACSADDAKPGARRATASQRSPGKKLTAVGTVEPEEVADVCAQVAGRIVSFGADPRANGKRIDFGSSVEVGAVLAQIDSEPYATRVEHQRAGCARAEAELAQAKARLEYADARREDFQERKKSKVAVSESDCDLARFDAKSAKASVAMAEAALLQNKIALKRAEIDLGHTTIKSPIKGIVVDRRINVGQVVAPAANSPSLFLVAKLERLQVWASVNEADIAKIRPQQRVRVTVDAFPGAVFEGQVKQIRLNAAMTQNQVAYTVVVALSSPTEKLLPYLTAQVEFE